jgi:hypothetical protein
MFYAMRAALGMAMTLYASAFMVPTKRYPQRYRLGITARKWAALARDGRHRAACAHWRAYPRP